MSKTCGYSYFTTRSVGTISTQEVPAFKFYFSTFIVVKFQTVLGAQFFPFSFQGLAISKNQRLSFAHRLHCQSLFVGQGGFRIGDQDIFRANGIAGFHQMRLPGLKPCVIVYLPIVFVLNFIVK